MNKYKAYYFDGVSTRATQVEISAYPGYILIEFPDPEKNQIKWYGTDISGLEERNGKIIFKYGKNFPFQMIEAGDKKFLQELRKENPDASYLNSPYSFFQNHGVKALVAGLTVIFGFLLLSYFFLIPWMMNGVAMIFPKNLEKELGIQMREAFIHDEKVDSSKTKNINLFYRQLKVDTDYDIHITVVKSEVQNAFALPGGEIVVFSSILDSMHSYNELAALLGHETGHIEKRHTLKLLLRSLSNYIIISAVFQDFSGVMAVIVENASMIERLSYNREVEEESDRFGFETLTKNKIDPNGMVALFEELNHSDPVSQHIPEFLMTHPKLEKRIKIIKERITHAKFQVLKNDSLNYYWGKLN